MSTINITSPLLTIKGLTVAFTRTIVIDNIDLQIYPHETFALVGESGSGKSLTALSVLRLLPPQARLDAESISLQQQELLSLSESEFCRWRGKRISLIFQDHMSSLNPVLTIGEQIAEVLRIHFRLNRRQIRQRVLELLSQVEIPQPNQRITAYPHQLSGGQRQRVMIAIALAAQPDLLIADEPTTALDVTIQAQILQLLRRLQQQTGMALWLISHDLALVSTIADRVAVMQKGKIVEVNQTTVLFSSPQHPYTQKLLAALPSFANARQVEQSSASILLQVKDFKVYYPIRQGIFKRIVDYVRAVDNIHFTVSRGRTLAIVGESGCGKTTLGKALLNLLPIQQGEVWLDQVLLTALSGEALRRQRAAIQMIFQDPFSAMNPRMLVGDIMIEGLKALQPSITKAETQAIIIQLLQQVDLPLEAALRYPHEFSGGQRQRICIARALAVKPKLIVCDEPTSALDVSVQAQIIRLLKQLQQQQGLSYLFISHDLAVVAEIADEIAVMYQGKIVEQQPTVQLLTAPQHPYTQKLLAAVPKLNI